MTDPPPAAPGLAYAAIMAMALLTAVFLKRRGTGRCPFQLWSGGGSRWERSAER